MPKAFGFTSYGGPETQQFLDVPVPEPGPGQLLVAVRAAGVNPVDWKIRSGALRDFAPVDLPAVLGREVSGVVEAVGPDVRGFGPGDEVFGSTAPGSGGFAERTLVSAGAAARKPDEVSFTDAAALPVAAATAYDAIEQLDLNPGQTLLINGIGGGVGVAAAQIARDRGVNVVGTASEGKRDLVESLGATPVAYGDGVADRVRDAAPGGVHGVLDLVGGDALRSVAGLVSDSSKLITAADPATAAEFGGRPVERDRTAVVLDRVAQLVAEGRLDPRVGEVRPLDQAADALAAVESGHAQGKVVVQVA